MSAIHNASGGCFLGDGLVRMGDGSERRVDELRAGDVVSGGATVVCVIQMELPTVDIVGVNGLGITAWHPVRLADSDEWQFPADCGIPQTHYNATVYNFVLSAHHILTINGVEACTLGHDMRGSVIGHPYFGTRAVRDDLEADPGWASGLIRWSGVAVERDPATGLVCGMRGLNSHRTS
jgi:hypothetical protein